MVQANRLWQGHEHRTWGYFGLMSLTTALLTPLVLLLPVAGAVEAKQDLPSQSPMGRPVAMPAPVNADPEPARAATDSAPVPGMQSWPFDFVSTGFQPAGAHQVRIEQRMTIRIAPRAASRSTQVRPNMFVGVPNQPLSSNFIERKMGKCLPVKNISGVQTNQGNSILLFMSDRRVVRAQLERSCSARDFYSGFYLANNSDGKLCVKRDELQSRSGANCRLTRIRQLVPNGN